MEVISCDNNDKKISNETENNLSEEAHLTLNAEKEDLSENKLLQQRVQSLKISMELLRTQLAEEKAMWKQEKENALKIASEIETVTETDSEFKYSDYDAFSIKGYEHKLLRYQEALQQAQQEQKLNLQRQIAISNYKRRLLEVENMCNLELLRVKQSVQFLQPLQTMLTEWNKSLPPPTVTLENDYLQTTPMMESIKTAPNEVEMPLELIGNKLQNDLQEIYKCSSNTHSNNSMPQLTSASAVWHTDNNYAGHSQSTIWYAECQTNYNAL